VSIKGKDAKFAQDNHEAAKFVPELVSIRGKYVKPVQPLHAPPKRVTELESTSGKNAILLQSLQAPVYTRPLSNDKAMSTSSVPSTPPINEPRIVIVSPSS
jgi:hypothetical protein